MDEFYKHFGPGIALEARSFLRNAGMGASEQYLYYKEGGVGSFGDIRIDSTQPDGYKLATPERVSLAFTVQQVERWALEIAKRLPIMSY